jgi:general secretion pathway protein D
MRTNNLRRLLAILAMALAMVGAADAKNRKGDKYLKEGKAAEAREQWDEALAFYEKALATDPSDPEYLLVVRKARFETGARHVAAGQKLRQQGQLEAALKEFQKALLADSASAVALQEWRRTTDMVEEEKTGKRKAGPDAGLTPAELARKEMDERAKAILPPPELKPISQLPSTLKMNNQPPRVLYETVGKLAGINVVFDPQFTPPGGKNFNLDLSNATLEQALDYLAVLTKTFWKPISANTIFVTEDNITKRRDYEDNVVRVFYVQNATSVQEFQEIVTAVRSVTEIRRVYAYNAQHAVLMRGTPDQIALAEKLIHDLDKAKAEVVVDIIVMSVSSSKTRTLAAQIASAGGTGGLNVPIGFTPRNPVLINGSSTGTTTTGTTTTGTTTTGTTTTSSNLISLAQVAHVSTNDFSTTLPGALLNLVMSDSNTKVLQSPQVRASDGQKVTLRIGQKIPYATGSLSAGVGAVGGLPYANTQFNFAEVGVNVDITPTVHGRDEVTLKMMIEVSNVSSHVTIGGVDQPVIAQQRSETEIRLREGEVNILAGLSQDSNSKTLNGVPGLVNIPLLGRLMGGESTDREKSDLLMAVIPHIVRTPNLTDVDLKGIAAGSDQIVKVNYTPHTSPAPAPSTGGEKVTPVPPAGAVPAVTVPAAPPPGVPRVPSPAAGPRLVFMPPSAQSQLSGAITVTLQAENVHDLFTASPVRVKWDPKVLRLNEIVPGELLARDNQRVTSAKDIRNDAGEAWITMNRLPGVGGVSGSGALATFSFSAIGKGTTKVTVTDAALKNTQLQPVVVASPEMDVNIQ